MEIALTVIGFILTTTGVYFWASRIFRRSAWKEIHGHCSQGGPIVIDKIVGIRYDHGEPTLRNRPAREDESKPWETHRDEESANHFFEWQWRERTEDEPGDAYYDLTNTRWWQFKKLSKNSPNGEGPKQVYERR